MNLFNVINLFRKAPKQCEKCDEKFNSNNLLITISDLKWEQKEQKREKTTRGIFDVSGGVDYREITRYKVYYRFVVFSFKCPKCGALKNWSTRYDLYDGRCGHSQSNAEEMRLLKSKIAQTIGEELWNNGFVKMTISHEL